MVHPAAVTIAIAGLRERYGIGQHIAFSVVIKGILKGRGFPMITITKEDLPKPQIYGMAFMSSASPTPKYMLNKGCETR